MKKTRHDFMQTARDRAKAAIRDGPARSRFTKERGMIKSQEIPGLTSMAAQIFHKQKFAICIHSDDADLLTPRRVYEVLPDESAAQSQYIRVIDNEGEDYLYPLTNFVFVDLPPAVEEALRRAS